MFKIVIVFIHFLMLVIFSPCISAEVKIKHTTIIFATEMADISAKGGKSYSRLATLIKQIRSEHKNTVFVFGGGSISPSPMSSFDRGSNIIDILNTLEPDIMTLAKSDFGYFEDELSLRSYEAAFPLVVSNIYDPIVKGSLDGLYETALITKMNSKIGFINIIASEVVTEYRLKRAIVIEPKTVLTRLTKKLRAQGAELIIMTYSKFDVLYPQLLSSSVINLAINVRTDKDNAELSEFIHNRNFGISDDNKALKLELSWQTNKPETLNIEENELNIAYYPQDPEVALQVKDYNNRLDRLLNQQIGTLSKSVHSIRQSVRTEENALANFITDAMRSYAKSDVSLLNGGAIRGEKTYTPETILTRKDIAQELPFRGRLAITSVTGKKLKALLEHGVSEIENLKGRFPHISGAKFTYSPSALVGNRIKSVEIQGKPLDSNATYTLATTDYLLAGGDNYPLKNTVSEANHKKLNSPLITDIVINAIQKQQNIAPEIESRIVRLSL